MRLAMIRHPHLALAVFDDDNEHHHFVQLSRADVEKLFRSSITISPRASDSSLHEFLEDRQDDYFECDGKSLLWKLTALLPEKSDIDAFDLELVLQAHHMAFDG